jgi:radical SAM protein with 4Fe4S-binding SPASM domain
MFAAEGEPLLHTGLKTMISRTKSRGVDCALATNGALMDELFLKASLRHLTWVRVSVDAGTASTYARIHTARKEDFTRVLGNIEKAVRIKKKNALKVTIGVQFLLLKENAAEAVKLASILSGMGVDYLAVKPYSKHPLSSNDAGTEINYSGMLFLEGKLNRFSKKGFNVIFRKNTMLKRSKAKSYERCLGLPFWAYISADGEVYPCHTFLGIKKMSFGNINELSFRKIWEGGKRAKVMKYLTTKMDAGKCREMCRLDEMNAYLWKLAHPHPHVNFI